MIARNAPRAVERHSLSCDASLQPARHRALAFGVVYIAMMLTIAVTLAQRTRQIAVDGPAAGAEQRFRRMNVLVLVLAGYAMAILLSLARLESIPALGDTLRGRVWIVLLLIGVLLAPTAAARLLF